MSGLEIRDARPEDYATFVRLVPELAVDDPIPDVDRWTQHIYPTMIVAERGGEAVGYSFYRVLTGAGHLNHIVSAPSARRSGVGRALFTSVIERVKAKGATELYLNVKPQNTAAVALYSSFGLTRWSRSWAVRMPWSIVEAAPAPHLDRVRQPEISEDAALERAHDLPPGLLATQRGIFDRIYRVIDPGTLAAFDPGFPGAYPFLAESVDHAMSVLHALRPFAKPGQDHINLSLGDQLALKDALLETGATLRLEIMRMKGPI